MKERLHAVREAVTESRMFKEVSLMASKVREEVTTDRVLIVSGLTAALSIGVFAGAALATEGRIQLTHPLILVPNVTAVIAGFSGTVASFRKAGLRFS